MLAPLTPLEAYRADVRARGAASASTAGDDGCWLLAAELVARLAEPERGRSARLRAALAELLGVEWPEWERDAEGTDAAIARDLSAEAERMEEGGAARLAYEVLALVVRATPAASGAVHGAVVAQRARVARKLGELDVADALYLEAARRGRRAGAPEVVARAALGRGVVARERGNYPAARALFRRGLRMAERAGLPGLRGVAHHGLLIAAAKAGDFETALQHGWAAIELAGDDAARVAELLVNVAAVSSDAGFDASALRGYVAAAARATAPRIRLPALAGAALSAARLGDEARVRALTDELRPALASAALPYERADALVLLAEAWATLAPASGGQPFARRARALADAYGFHELAHRANETGMRAARARAATGAARALSRPTRRVLAALASLGEAPGLTAPPGG
jgi:hypothetical protein